MADRSKVESAIRYVAEFSLRVQEQRRWIAVLKRQGHPIGQAEALLIAFEDSLSLAKKHLALVWDTAEVPLKPSEAAAPEADVAHGRPVARPVQPGRAARRPADTGKGPGTRRRKARAS